MEFSDLLQTRQSTRAFLPNPVDGDSLAKILSCLNSVPSAGNLQSYEILVVRDPALKAEIGAATTACAEPVSQAPLALVFIANAFRSGLKYGERGIGLFCIQDTTIAATYIMLAATDLGFASLWVGGFNNPKVSNLLNLGQGQWPIVIMPIGYPNEKPARRTRRSIQDVVHDLG